MCRVTAEPSNKPVDRPVKPLKFTPYFTANEAKKLSVIKCDWFEMTAENGLLTYHPTEIVSCPFFFV